MTTEKVQGFQDAKSYGGKEESIALYVERVRVGNGLASYFEAQRSTASVATLLSLSLRLYYLKATVRKFECSVCHFPEAS